MKNSKLIELLVKLEPLAIKNLHLFLRSPFFVPEGSPELKLFEYLLPLYPDFEASEIEKSLVFQKLFKNRAYKPIRMYQLMSSLVKLIEQFMIQNHRNRPHYHQKISQELNLYDCYQELGVLKWIKAQERKLVQLQNESSAKSIDFYYYQYQIEIRIQRFKSYSNNRQRNISLSTIFDNYNIYFCINLMNLLCMHYTDKKIFQQTANVPSIEAIDHLLELLKVKDIAVVQVYRQAIQMLQSDQEVDFLTFKASLLQYLPLFPFAEAYNLWTYALNFINRQMGKGNTTYDLVYFEWYQLGIKEKIFYYGDKILAPHLKNIVRISLSLEKYDWVSQFLAEHQHRILAVNSAEVYQFNLAEIAFRSREYEQALHLIATHQFKDLFYELSAKRMELKIMYELGEFMVLDSKLNAFKVYIHRNKTLLANVKESNGNFAKILGRLRKTIPSEPKHIERLNRAFAKIKGVSEKKWLIEKMDLLKQRE